MKDTFSGGSLLFLKTDRTWGTWGSCDGIPRAIFYLLRETIRCVLSGFRVQQEFCKLNSWSTPKITGLLLRSVGFSCKLNPWSTPRNDWVAAKTLIRSDQEKEAMLFTACPN